MLPEGAREAAQAALEAASSWTCSRCLARRQASKMKQPDCSTCTTVLFHRPNQPSKSVGNASIKQRGRNQSLMGRLQVAW